MPKVLITGDWQLDSRPPCDRRDKRGKSTRFAENVGVLMDMVADAKARGCTRMVFLGDLTEELNPDSKSLDAAAMVFRAAMDAGMTVDAVAGNHDGSIFEISSSSLEPLSRMAPDRFRVHHEVSYTGGRDQPTFVYLPYLHQATPEQVRAELVKVTDTLEGDLYLFGHYGAKLSRMGAKNLILPGDYLDADTMLAKQFKGIWMGHIHKAQTFLIDGTPFRHPGSPYICDFGERDDAKGYCVFDTETHVDQWIELKPKRNWVVVNYDELENRLSTLAADAAASFDYGWTVEDVVKFVGVYEPGKNPREIVRLKLKNGDWPQPFYVVDEFKRLVEGRDVRAGVEAVAGAGGFAEAVAAFVAQRWPAHPRAAEVIKTVVDELKESKLASLERFVTPTRVVVKDFMSHRLWDETLVAGQTTLIVGPNGMGKTNLFEAVLFALTGETSKGLKNPMLVRQGAKKASVLLFLQGEKNLFFISRTLTLTKAGATHKVEAGTAPIRADPDWYLDKKKHTSLADGGVTDTQAAISAIVGATFKSLKATNFMFQNDPSPVIKADPMERKSILSEILGFEPMAKAFKVLDDRRLGAKRTLADRKAELEGLRSAIDPAKEQEVRDSLAATEARVPGLRADAEAKAKDADRTKLLADGAAALLERANAELQAMPNSSGLLTGAEDQLKTLERSFTEERERRVRTYTSDKSQIAQVQKDIMAVDVKALTARAEELKAAKASFQATVNQVNPEIERLAAVKTTARTKLEGLDQEHAGFGREIAGLKTNDVDKCSKCGGKVDSAHIKKEIADLEARAMVNREACINHNFVIQQADKDLSGLNERRNVAETGLRAANTEVEQVVGKVAKVQGQIEELGRLETRFKDTEEQGKKAKEQFEAKKKEFEQKIADLKMKVEQENKGRAKNEEIKVGLATTASTTATAAGVAATALADARVALAGAEASLGALRTAIEGFAETKAKVVAKEEAIKAAEADLELRVMASETLDAKAGLPVWLIDARIPELEDAINRYMDLFGAGGLSVRLSTVKEDGKETLDVLVDNGEEPILDVAAYSGGEKDRMEICVKLALADLAESMRDVRLGLLAYDEPGVHLDEERKAKLIEMIHERCVSGRTPVAIVISHDRKLMSGFRRRLAISKTEDETELVAA